MADNTANDTNHVSTERPVDATTENPAQESLNRNQPVRSTTSRDVGTTADEQKTRAQLKQEDAAAQEKHAKIEQGRQKKDEKAQKVSEKTENLADKAKDTVDHLASNVQEKTARASTKADEKADETHRTVEEGRQERRDAVTEQHIANDRASHEDTCNEDFAHPDREHHGREDDDRETHDSEEVLSENLEVISRGGSYEVSYIQRLDDGMVKRVHFFTTNGNQTYYDILGESRKRVENEKPHALDEGERRHSLSSRESRWSEGETESSRDHHSRNGRTHDEDRSTNGRDSSYSNSLRGAFTKLFETFNNGSESERDSSRDTSRDDTCHCNDREPLSKSQYDNDRRRLIEVAQAHRKPAHDAYDMLEENNRLLTKIARHLNIDTDDNTH